MHSSFDISTKIETPSPPNFDESGNGFPSMVQQSILPVILVRILTLLPRLGDSADIISQDIVFMKYNDLRLNAVMKQV